MPVDHVSKLGCNLGDANRAWSLCEVFFCSNNFSSALVIYIKSDHLDRYVSYQGWLSSLFLFYLCYSCVIGELLSPMYHPQRV